MRQGRVVIVAGGGGGGSRSVLMRVFVSCSAQLPCILGASRAPSAHMPTHNGTCCNFSHLDVEGVPYEYPLNRSWLNAESARRANEAGALLMPAILALLGKRVLPPPRGRGTLMVLTQSEGQGTDDAEPEIASAARLLRNAVRLANVVARVRGQTDFSMALACDSASTRQLQASLGLWDHHLLMHPEAALQAIYASGLAGPARFVTNVSSGLVEEGTAQNKFASRKVIPFFVWKLLVQLASPFEETLFIDNDILVLSVSFVTDLIEHSLHLSDLAFVQDPNRPATREAKSGLNQYKTARRNGYTIRTPFMYGHGYAPHHAVPDGH